MQTLREQFRTIRRDRGLSQKDLGTRLGMPQSHISAIEAGKVDPRLSSVTEMARLLDHEIIVVPRKLLRAVQRLLSGEPDAPLWQAAEDEQ